MAYLNIYMPSAPGARTVSSETFYVSGNNCENGYKRKRVADLKVSVNRKLPS